MAEQIKENVVMINGNVDLHMHTICSDGTHTPDDVLRMCDDANLSFVSITDHDSVDAYGMISYDSSCRIIPGIEMTTSYDGEIIEVLGYGIDVSKMKQVMSVVGMSLHDRHIRDARIKVDTLVNKGVKLNEEFVEAIKNDPCSMFNPSMFSANTVILHEIQRHGGNRRFFRTNEELSVFDAKMTYDSKLTGFFGRHIINDPNNVLYCDTTVMFPSLSQAIEHIHDCGGYAFIAHLYSYSNSVSSSIDDIIDGYQIDGIECSYATFTSEQTESLLKLCRKHGLLVSGGSDFHGLSKRPNNVIGHGTAFRSIPYCLVAELVTHTVR